MPFLPPSLNIWPKGFREPSSLSLMRSSEGLAVRPQDHAPRLGRCQRNAGAVPDNGTLVFGEHRHHLQGHSISFGHVGTADFHSGIEQLSDEGQAPGEAIQPGDKQRRLTAAAQGEGSSELRTGGY